MNKKDILGNIKSLIVNGKFLENEETLINTEMAKEETPVEVTEEVPVTEEIKDKEEMATDVERIAKLEGEVESLKATLEEIKASLKPAEKEEPKEDEPIVEMAAVVIPPKKFTGAPVEEKTVLTGIVTRKTQDTKSRVFDRMANSKL